MTDPDSHYVEELCILIICSVSFVFLKAFKDPSLSLVPVLQQSGRYQAQRPYQQDYLECAIRIKVSIGSNNIERS